VPSHITWCVTSTITGDRRSSTRGMTHANSTEVEGGVLLKNLTVPKQITLCKPKVHYHVHKNLVLVRVLCQRNPLQDFSCHIFNIYFNSIIPSKPRCSNWSVDVTFSNQNRYAFLNSNRRATRPTHSTQT